MSKILVKQAPAVQQFQQIGAEEGSRPSMMQLFGRFKDPTANRMDKVRAGLGLAGKFAALGATGIQVANQLQGGNIGGALGAGYTYAGIDPVTGMKRDVTPAEQQRTMVMDAQKTANTQDLQAMTNAGIDVTNPAAATQAQVQQYQEQSPFNQQQPQTPQTSTGTAPPGTQSPTLGQLKTQQTQPTTQPTTQVNQPTTQPTQTTQVAGALAATVPQGMFGQPPAPAAPAPAAPAPAQPANPNLITSYSTNPAAPAAPAQPAPAAPQYSVGPQNRTGFVGNQANTGMTGPPPAVPQGDEIDQFIARRGRMPASNTDRNEIDAMNADEVRRRVDNIGKSFVDMMFNEFGDLFQKQDPDTVAAIITGIYLDKMVR